MTTNSVDAEFDLDSNLTLAGYETIPFCSSLQEKGKVTSPPPTKSCLSYRLERYSTVHCWECFASSWAVG